MHLKLNQLRNHELYSSLKAAIPGPLTLEWTDLHLLQNALTGPTLPDENLEVLLYGNREQPIYSGFTLNRVNQLLGRLSDAVITTPSPAGTTYHANLPTITLNSECENHLKKELARLSFRNQRKEVRAKAKEWFYRFKSKIVPSPLNAKTIRLNLGAGSESYPHFIKVDWAGPQDVYDDIVSLSTIKNNSVDEIYSNHVLEHIPPFLIREMLKRWHEVLKKGGVLKLRAPDARQTILNLDRAWSETSEETISKLGFPNYLKKENTFKGEVTEALAIQFIYGWSDSMPNHWDSSNQHKSLWTPALGRKRLEKAGFKVTFAENLGTLQTVLIAEK